MGGAECGRLEVFEDRESGQGRTIELKVIVLPALGGGAAPDPLFLLAGGPGMPASALARVAESGTAPGARAPRDRPRRPARHRRPEPPPLRRNRRRLDLLQLRPRPPGAAAARLPGGLRRRPESVHHPGGDGRSRRRAPGPGLRADQPVGRVLRHARGPGLPAPPPGARARRRPRRGRSHGDAHAPPHRRGRPALGGADARRLRGRPRLRRGLPPSAEPLRGVARPARGGPRAGLGAPPSHRARSSSSSCGAGTSCSSCARPCTTPRRRASCRW